MKAKLNLFQHISIQDQKLHNIVFVNNKFPYNDIINGVADVSSSWFGEYYSDKLSFTWRNNKSFPLIYKVDNPLELLAITTLQRQKTISKIGNEIIAICLGPMYIAEVIEYSKRYRKL